MCCFCLSIFNYYDNSDASLTYNEVEDFIKHLDTDGQCEMDKLKNWPEDNSHGNRKIYHPMFKLESNMVSILTGGSNDWTFTQKPNRTTSIMSHHDEEKEVLDTLGSTKGHSDNDHDEEGDDEDEHEDEEESNDDNNEEIEIINTTEKKSKEKTEKSIIRTRSQKRKEEEEKLKVQSKESQHDKQPLKNIVKPSAPIEPLSPPKKPIKKHSNIQSNSEQFTPMIKKWETTMQDQQNQISNITKMLEKLMDNKNNEIKKSKDDGSQFNFDFITSKHDQKLQELNNDPRFDSINYKKQKKSKKKPKSTSSWGAGLANINFSKLNTSLQNSKLISSKSITPKKTDLTSDKLHTPEQQKTLKRYRPKTYKENSIEYFQDQQNPRFETEELTDDDEIDDQFKAEYDHDGIRNGYIFNVGIKDKYNLRYERLMEKKYIERLYLDQKNLVSYAKNDEILKEYKKLNIKYEDNNKYPIQ